jgi:hypothetical protein
MQNEFLPYDRALKLKQLGFDEPCISHYTAYGKFSNDYSAPKKYNSEFELGSYISAPLFQQAFRWFRDEHELFSSCDISNFADKTYGYVITSPIPKHYLHNVHSLKGIEEAELACLDKLIEIVELKNKDNGL